jgi:2-polyprenyl-3-methyl-5-hydroxy-6-metoxy-1,4-benzoquinol methylase
MKSKINKHIRKTKEPQYQICLDIKERQGVSEFGLMSNQVWHEDPRRFVFMLARYKFVSKMFSGMKNVLEVGCADAFGTRIVLQEVGNIVAIDFDPVFVEDATLHYNKHWPIEVRLHNILDGPVVGEFDGIFSLDVLEHIQQKDECIFISNIIDSLNENGVAIIGTPSIQSQEYASKPSKEGHVNCKNASSLKYLMSQYFNNVFIFSMNDEVVHTGYYPMAHYLIALCCKPIRTKTGSNYLVEK